MAVEVFNRYEKKYFLDEKTYHRFLDRLQEYMEPDEYNRKHGFYTITNVYFDTRHDTLIRHSLTKPKYKEKLRLRSYGVPEQPGARVYLELKKKLCGLVHKRRSKLGLDEAYEFVRTGVLPPLRNDMNPPVLAEIQNMLFRYALEPRAYLAYERKALFSRESRELRITFDTNIRSRRYDLRLESGDYGEPLLDAELWLMEVKAAKAMPVWLSRLLSEHRLCSTSFSKYGCEYKKYIAGRYMTKDVPVYA